MYVCLEIFTLHVGYQAFELQYECQCALIHTKIYKKTKNIMKNKY